MFSKRPPRYGAKHDTLSEPHDLGFMLVEKKSWYYELATSPVWLWDEVSFFLLYFFDKTTVHCLMPGPVLHYIC